MKGFFLAVWLLIFCSMSSFAGGSGSDSDENRDEKGYSEKSPNKKPLSGVRKKPASEKKASSAEKKPSSSAPVQSSGTPSTPINKGKAQSNSGGIYTPLSSSLQSLALDSDSNQSISSSASQSVLPMSQRQARASTSNSEAATPIQAPHRFHRTNTDPTTATTPPLNAASGGNSSPQLAPHDIPKNTKSKSSLSSSVSLGTPSNDKNVKFAEPIVSPERSSVMDRTLLLNSAPPNFRQGMMVAVARQDFPTPTKQRPSTAGYMQKPEWKVEEKKADKTTNSIYGKQRKVSHRFLYPKNSKNLLEEASVILEKFKKEYNAYKGSIIDITNLSSRSRIYLLREIINFKINHLKGYKAGMWGKDFKLIDSNKFWERVEGGYEGKNTVKFKDKIPTLFKIGQFEYMLEMESCHEQRGGGRLKGLILANKDIADTYSNVFDHIKGKTAEELHVYSSSLLGQKEHGGQINVGSNEENCFLNGFNLLLDYEVARRLIEVGNIGQYPSIDESFIYLPVVAYLKFILEDLKSCYDVLILGNGEDQEEYFGKEHDVSLVMGKTKRDVAAKSFIRKILKNEELKDRVRTSSEMRNVILRSMKSSRLIRDNLKFLHKDNENSESDYSSDECFDDENEQEGKPEDDLPEIGKLNIFVDSLREEAQRKTGIKVEEFLKAVPRLYIEGIRNGSLSGGDTELPILSDILQKKISVHQWKENDGESEEVIHQDFSPSEPIKVDGQINLWFDKNTQCYKIYNLSTGKTKKKVGEDSDSLFHAALGHAVRNGEVVGNMEDVPELRNKVANKLDNVKGRKEIKGIFEEVFKGINEEKLKEALNKLSPCRLRDEVRDLGRILLSSTKKLDTQRMVEEIKMFSKKYNRPPITIFNESQTEAEEQQLVLDINRFLGNISDRYITEMRRATGEGVLWGGDIELMIAAALLLDENVAVNVNGTPANTIGIREDIRANNIQVNLSLRNWHYQIYDSTGKLIDVDRDGNCQFHTMLIAGELNDNEENILWLRDAVAENIRDIVRQAEEDPIRLMFNAIVYAENEAQLDDALGNAPPGLLRDEAGALARRQIALRAHYAAATADRLQNPSNGTVNQGVGVGLELPRDINFNQPSGNAASIGRSTKTFQKK